MLPEASTITTRPGPPVIWSKPCAATGIAGAAQSAMAPSRPAERSGCGHWSSVHLRRQQIKCQVRPGPRRRRGQQRCIGTANADRPRPARVAILPVALAGAVHRGQHHVAHHARRAFRPGNAQRTGIGHRAGLPDRHRDQIAQRQFRRRRHQMRGTPPGPPAALASCGAGPERLRMAGASGGGICEKVKYPQ